MYETRYNGTPDASHEESGGADSPIEEEAPIRIRQMPLQSLGAQTIANPTNSTFSSSTSAGTSTSPERRGTFNGNQDL